MKAPGPRWLSADDAAALVQPGWTVASAGFVGAGHAEAVTEALERRWSTAPARATAGAAA